VDSPGVITVLIAAELNPRELMAQSDARLPTDPSNPLKLFVNKLNDPQRGAALRAQWNIDRSVWVEPVSAVRNRLTLRMPIYIPRWTAPERSGARMDR
jgi:hypothetical protein